MGVDSCNNFLMFSLLFMVVDADMMFIYTLSTSAHFDY